MKSWAVRVTVVVKWNWLYKTLIETFLEAMITEKMNFKVGELCQVGSHRLSQNEAGLLNTWHNRRDGSDNV